MLGAALAMDAFSVSIANGLTDREMKTSKVAAIAGTFALFQFSMPMIGWLLVHTAMEYLEWFEKMVPWIALILLCFIGAKMIIDGLAERKCIEGDAASCEIGESISIGLLITQGIATSIDALSVGFTTASYGVAEALLSSGVIGLVTFAICTAGCLIGKKAGSMMSWKATILGGLILIAIGIKIFVG